jgi:mono/diheme cytochrome c family protein
MRRFGLLPGLTIAVAGWCSAAEADAAAALAILTANCAQCHSKQMAMSGLDLSSREAVLKGGTGGPAIVAGDAGSSKLIAMVERKGKVAMPPTKPLTESEVAVLRTWIDGGAKWPENATAAAPKPPQWWSFQPVKRPAVPKSGDSWAKNALDEFILAKLKEQSLRPSPMADRATLARRAYFDLWGLPPTLNQVQEFVDDRSADAWPKLIDKLLASPRYGEKWGRHWLDLVRYSDTAGFELDSYIHDAWRYRDWVVQAFNDDMPYDRFIRDQIAADELAPEDPVARTGTGMYCVGPNRDLFPDQADINRDEILTDYVDTTSAVFLGLTAGCARCHDHKFDPISQEDYYRVQAVFAPAVKVKVPLDRLTSLFYDVSEGVREWKLREFGDRIRAARARCADEVKTVKMAGLPDEVKEALRVTDRERTQRQRELATEYEGRVRTSDDEIRACMNPQETAQLHEMEKALVRMYADYRSKPFACGLADMWNVSPRTFLPARGGRPEREVQPGFFSVLGGGEVPPPAEKRETTGPIPLMPTTGRRTALAHWISDPSNPLTARVMANRIWQYHFGRGLVATPSDFGTRGGRPTHPELLDWLASEFVSQGWSIKKLHRTMMLSAAYQQQANPSKESAEKDPQNLYLSHFTRRRLMADEVRDSVLAATGALNLKMGGRPVVPPLSEEEKAMLTQRPDDAWVLTGDTSEHTRRSIYLIQKRTFRAPMMEVFDAPDSMLTCARRESSTTAPQSLSLFNGSLTMERSRDMGTRLAAKHTANAEAVQAAWRQLLAREPNAGELARATKFLDNEASHSGDRAAAVSELIRALLNLNEFLYVD